MKYDFVNVNQFLDSYKKNTPGMCLSVLKNHEIIYQRNVGQANVEYGIPLTNESVFNLASLSKPITALGVIILKEEEKISYDDSIVQYFPELSHYCQEVTIRHLLNHTSGIINYYRILDRIGLKDIGFTNDECFQLLKKEKTLQFKPGNQFDYSNSNYVLLNLLIERVSKKSFNEFLKEKVFKPLGMKSALVYNEEQPIIKNRAYGYGIRENNTVYCDYIGSLTTGDGSIFASMKDLIEFEKVIYANPLVNKESMKEALTTSVLNDGSLGEYGFGWETKRSPNEFYHTGLEHGSRALFITFPKKKLTIILLANFNELSGKSMRDLTKEIYFQVTNEKLN